jgi:hypothetical protein
MITPEGNTVGDLARQHVQQQQCLLSNSRAQCLSHTALLRAQAPLHSRLLLLTQCGLSAALGNTVNHNLSANNFAHNITLLPVNDTEKLLPAKCRQRCCPAPSSVVALLL